MDEQKKLFIEVMNLFPSDIVFDADDDDPMFLCPECGMEIFFSDVNNSKQWGKLIQKYGYWSARAYAFCPNCHVRFSEMP